MQDIERVRISQRVGERFWLPVIEDQRVAALRDFGEPIAASGHFQPEILIAATHFAAG
jgi:hypothetical protein